MEGRRRRRWRARIDDHAGAVVVGALVVAALGLGLVYVTTIAPGSVTETETLATWETTPAFDHRAEVRRSNDVYDRGTIVENRTVYFTRIAPVLEGEFTFGVAGAPGSIDTTIDTTLVLRSVTDEDVEVWRVTEPLDARDVTVSTGETASVPFELNVSAVMQRVDAIEEDLGGAVGATEILVRGSVQASGTVADGALDHEGTHVLRIEPEDGTYRVSTEAEGEDFSRTTTVTEDRSYGPVRRAAGPALLIVGLGAGLGVAVARRRGILTVSERERAVLAYHDHREEFDEWITTGSVPPEVRSATAIAVDDLEGLVDLAIDSEARVVEDPEAGAYYVLTEERLYTFTPPESSTIPG